MTVYKKPEWFFYPAWILGSALGVALGFGLALIVLSAVTEVVGDTMVVNGVRHITEDYLGGYLMFPLIGLGVGLVQYLLLRRYLPRMGGWVLATVAVFVGLVTLVPIISSLLTLLEVTELGDRRLLPAVMYFLAGLTLGLAQWLLLRRRVRASHWWLAISVIGWAVVYPVLGQSLNSTVEVLLFGLVPAGVTAIGIGLLINATASSQPEPG